MSDITSNGTNKSKRITIRLTPEELARLRKAARKDRMKPSAFIRAIVRKAVAA